MFDFLKFRSKKPELDISEDNNILASITFFVTNDKTPCVDISLIDYEQSSIDAMCALLNILATEQASVQAVKMIKDGLIEANQPEILLDILTKIRYNVTKSLADSTLKDKPYIKPSDML